MARQVIWVLAVYVLALLLGLAMGKLAWGATPSDAEADAAAILALQAAARNQVKAQSRKCDKPDCDCGCREGETCRCAPPATRPPAPTPPAPAKPKAKPVPAQGQENPLHAEWRRQGFQPGPDGVWFRVEPDAPQVITERTIEVAPPSPVSFAPAMVAPPVVMQPPMQATVIAMPAMQMMAAQPSFQPSFQPMRSAPMQAPMQSPSVSMPMAAAPAMSSGRFGGGGGRACAT